MPIVAIAQPFTRDDWNRGSYVLGGRCEIVNVLTGKPLTAEAGRVEQVSEAAAAWEVRSSPKGGRARYQIVHRLTGLALTEVPSVNLRKPFAVTASAASDDDPNQDWRIESYGDGSVMLIAASGRALDLPGGSRRDGTPLQTFLRNGETNQRFFLRPEPRR
jgi:hypothetical protein